MKNSPGITPCLTVDIFGHTQIVKLLIDHNAIKLWNVNELCRGESALFVAAKNGDEKLAKILIDSNADINLKTTTNGFTPLFWASISNHPNMIDLLVKNGADVNAKGNDHQETALHKMAHQGKLDMAKILLDNACTVRMVLKKPL